MRARSILAALVLSAIAFGGPRQACAQTQTKVSPGFNVFSAQQDVELGQKAAREIEPKLRLITDRRVVAYVSDMGERLAAQAEGPKFDYTFKVVDAPELNAFALPGGFVYVNRGLIDAADNEGEIAGVLAHEIAHVALRHGTQQATQGTLAEAGLGLLGGLLGDDSSKWLDLVGGVGATTVLLKYSREMESDADIEGVQILTRAGYNAADMISFYRKMEQSDSRRTIEWLSSHPPPARRTERIEREAQLMGSTLDPTESDARLHEIQRILAGQPARSGSTSGATPPRPSAPQPTSSLPQVASPSTLWRTYRSPDGLYVVRHPADWQVHETRGAGVTLAPQGGLVRGSRGTDVTYGALLNHYDGGEGSSRFGVSLEDATESLVDAVLRSSPHLRYVHGSGRRYRLPQGQTGLAATLAGRSQATGDVEQVIVFTRQLPDDHLVYLLFVTPQEDFGRFEPVLEEMIRSLRVSTAHDGQG